jgi:hypothetical protein
MTEPEIQFTERITRQNPRRVALLVGACLAVVVAAAVTMGASPSASPAAPGASATPGASGDPGKLDGGTSNGDGDFHGRGRHGGVGIHAISITGIDGSNLDLATEDGWTRTIAVTSATTITKAGQTIAVGDLAVGDNIRFSQTKGTDGSYTVTAIEVVLPSTAGTVTAKTATTITITRRDGTTQTINVDAATTYQVAGVTTATLGDVAVGMRLKAVGQVNADGSFDASSINAGTGKTHDRSSDHDESDETSPSASPSPTG